MGVLSIRHHAIVRADRRAAVHRRREDGGVETQMVTEGRIGLDPPGIGTLVEDLYTSRLAPRSLGQTRQKQERSGGPLRGELGVS